ncbi:uncharacterized protein LOC116238636 [Phasianus colchicus]|uniref:uncharacterized protein LOC116238636 n=1 Tax=Phasianus colchicus TaxID=9054 RepID=UPI00129EE65D|nr:uncharacterized protein LOC116238636 [Phasianus colchicus]
MSLGCAAAASPGVGVQLAVPGRQAPTSSLRTPAGTAQGLTTKAGKIHTAWRDAQEGSRDTRAATTPSSRAAQKGLEEQAGSKRRGKKYLPALVPEDADNLDSLKVAHSPEKADDAPFFRRVCEGGERNITATSMPEVSRQALGAALRLQDPRGVNQEAYGCSLVHRAIRRIRDEARREQMLSTWNISWPNVSMLRLLKLEAAHASASATDSAQGMLDTRATTSMVESPIPVPGEFISWDAGVQDEPHDSEEIAETETAGQSSGDLQSACLAPSDEAETVRSASLPDAGPGLRGHLEPLPTSVLEDVENSDSFETAHYPEVASAAPLLMSACEEREETVMAVLELSKQALGETSKLQDAREIYEVTYGYSPIFPAIFPETAGQSSGNLQSACVAQSDEAETAHSASLLDAGAEPAGQLEPLPASDPQDVENSDCFTAAHSLEVANEAPFFLPLSEGEEREEPAMAMSESSRQGLGETWRLQDPREIYWKSYGCPPVHPAILRIRDEARREKMLSSRNMSEPYSLSSPRLLVLQAADDGASAADTVCGMLNICTTTSRADGHFPASCDSHSRHIRIKYAPGESTDNAASDASTNHSMLDARDTGVRTDSMATPSFFSFDSVEGVEEEWEDNREEEAAEAASVPPSISHSSSGEMKTAAAHRWMPAVIRSVFRVLRRASICSCISGQQEETYEAANTRQLPRDV